MNKQHEKLVQEAILLHQRGDILRAEELYEEALSAGSQNPRAIANLALIKGARGHQQEMIKLLRQAISIRPSYAEAHNNLGNALRENGNIRESINCYKKALDLQPRNPAFYYNLAISQERLDEIDDATISYNKALQFRPDFPEALNNLGNLKRKQGSISDALESLRRCIEINPSYYKAHNNLGNALQDLGEIDAAIKSYKQAISLRPEYSEAICNLAVSLHIKGDFSGALSMYRKAIEIEPNRPEYHLYLGQVLLLTGDYVNGFHEYEYRLQEMEAQVPLHSTPKSERWKGNSADLTCPLLLVSEQGLGDFLMFVRFALLLKKQKIPIRICAPTRVHSLIKSSDIDTEPLTPEQGNEVVEGRWLPLLSTPLYIDEKTIGRAEDFSPYLSPPSDSFEHWKQIFSDEKKPIIGINWQGNRSQESEDGGRSIDTKTFCTALANCQDCIFVSLQAGNAGPDILTTSIASRITRFQDIVDHVTNSPDQLADYAAITANCDLIITSATTLAHLAGGLGKPTWVLIPSKPRWYWGLKGELTPWYPTIRLFRQELQGDWATVMRRVTNQLSLYCHQQNL